MWWRPDVAELVRERRRRPRRRVKRPSSSVSQRTTCVDGPNAGGERVRLARPRRDVLHAARARRARARLLDPRARPRAAPGLQRVRPWRASQPDEEGEEHRDPDEHRPRRRSTSRAQTVARARRRSDDREHQRQRPRARATAHARRTTPRRRTAPRPQWCCHQRRRGSNGSETNQSVTSTTIAERRSPLPIGPRPIPRTTRGSRHANTTSGDERRERRRASQRQSSPSRVAARPRAAGRAEEAVLVEPGEVERAARSSAQRSHAATTPDAPPRTDSVARRSAEPHARRRHLRHPRELPRARGGARGRSTREAPDEIWCLGDLVGYGPQPNECVARTPRARRRCLVRQPRPRRCSARLDARRLPRRRGGRGPLDAARARRRRSADLARALALAASARGRRALPRQPARPGLGLRAQRGGGAATRSRDDGAGRPRRPQPRRRSRVACGRRRLSRRARARGRPRSTSPAAAGCSTPARSASRATATRARPGCCSTSTRDWRRSAASRTRSSGRRRRSARAGCPRRSPRGSRSGSSAASVATARRRLGVAEGDALARERELDLFARLEDPPLDRRERDLERVGDLVVREADDVAQEQRHLQVGVQVLDRAPERVDRLRPLGRLVERLERRHVVERRRGDCGRRSRARSSSSTRFFVTWKSQVVNLQRSENSRQALEDPEEDLLRQVLGERPVAASDGGRSCRPASRRRAR